MKNTVKLQTLAVLALLGTGIWLVGCKSAPPLTSDQAMSMIQAKYSQDQGAPFSIIVDDRGMQLGANAKYWAGTKRYPNGYWGDFALTPDGKKVVKLPSGGDVIQWRPDRPNDPNYSIVIVPLMVSHHKARDAGEVQTIGDTRTVTFTEDVDLTGMPDPLQAIAHDPGNKLSTQRLATFTLNNGAWTLQTID